MHRTCGSAAIHDGLLFIADYSGVLHCLDAKSGKQHWAYDQLASCCGTPLIVDGHVYITDEDGDVSVFGLSANPDAAMPGGAPVSEVNVNMSAYAPPIVANGVLYITTQHYLFAIAKASEGD